MSRCKYIMFDETNPILFREHLNHSDMANHLSGLGEVTSAGFVQVYVETFEKEFPSIEVSVFGESVSLKMKSNPVDAIWIKKMFED